MMTRVRKAPDNAMWPSWGKVPCSITSKPPIIRGFHLPWQLWYLSGWQSAPWRYTSALFRDQRGNNCPPYP